jgi:hypothetical protein
MPNQPARTRVGSFLPEQPVPCLYAMAGDDCSLHFDLTELTPGQQADHEANQALTGMLQVALTGIGKPEDYVALYDRFTEAPWAGALARYHDAFRRMGLSPVEAGHFRYHPRDGYYESVAADLPDVPMINLYMTSGSNAVLHGDPDALEVSRNVNSKLHFALHAPAFGIPVPYTLVTTKGRLDGAEVADLFRRYPGGLMLKTLGLAGARNVTSVASVGDCRDYLEEYPDDLEILLQEKLDTRRFTEMTVDLDVSDSRISISNVRRILFADGLWVGNLLGDSVPLPDAHRAALLKVGEYARAQGYTTPEGSNCGIDYFIDGDEVVVTEINARWTGGLFPVQFLKQLSWTGDAVAFIDMAHQDDLDQVLSFIDAHRFDPAHPPAGAGQFGFVPMGFSPYPTELNGEPYVFVWQIVLGDFEAFKAARRAEVSERVFITADRISPGLG